MRNDKAIEIDLLNKKNLAYAGLLSGILLISFSAIFVKLAAVESSVSAFYRCFYAAFILFGIACFRGEVRREGWPWLVPALWAGAFLAVDLIIWHKTIFYIGAGPATLVGNSQVIFVTIFCFFIFKERISSWFPLLIPLIFLGLYLAIPKIRIMIAPGTGLLLGSIVGLAYSGYLISLRYAKNKARSHYPEILSLSVIMAVTATIVGLYGGIIEGMSFIVPSWKSQVYLVLMALFPQSIGWILIKTSITRIPSHQGSLLLLLQPILTTFWGRLFLDEPLSLLQIFGILLALGLIALYQLRLAPKGEP